jgi:hypothetical protein
MIAVALHWGTQSKGFGYFYDEITNNNHSHLDLKRKRC